MQTIYINRLNSIDPARVDAAMSEKDDSNKLSTNEKLKKLVKQFVKEASKEDEDELIKSAKNPSEVQSLSSRG